MNKVNVGCEWCGKDFEKTVSEFNRAERLGRKHFCSLNCSCSYRNSLPAAKALRTKRNKEYLGERNPNWKGGVSPSEATRRARQKFPEKTRARRAIQGRVARGTIVKPKCCAECGARADLEAHHSDYGKPLDVLWVCRTCHERLDRLVSD